VRMPGMDGFQLLEAVKTSWPDIPVVLLTAHGNVPLAVDAMKKGAADFLMKPFDRELMLAAISRCAQMVRAEGPLVDAPPPNDQGFLGESKAMVEVRSLIHKAAQSQSTVLIRGESGTGKELAAKALHQASPRAQGPFVRFQCGALPESLIESELFGYEKGAFTGAVARKLGRVELAQGGTLFLDEIGDVPLPVQVKLLRLLQEREFERLGGTQTFKADVRFVAATHQPLEELVRSGRFREDLFHRLNVIPVHLPALRERSSDIPRLAEHFIRVHGGKVAADSVLNRIAMETWRGNVRELQNFIERLVVLSPNPAALTESDVERELGRRSPLMQEATRSSDLDEARRSAEREALRVALDKAGNNRTKAARILGVSRRTLYNKLSELGLA
jgi:two-component system response regulator AtoC